MNFFEIRQLRERVLVSQRNVYDPVVGEDAQRVIGGHLLSASGSSGRHKDTSVFTGEGTRCPKTASRVPESLPLSWGVTKSSGNAEEESVIGGQNGWGDDWVVAFGRSVHLLQDVLREGFRDPEE